MAAQRPVLSGRGFSPGFEDDDRRLGRAPAGVRVEVSIDRAPALPQPVALLPRRRAGAHRARVLARQPDDGVRMRLEVEPPGGMPLLPAVHREGDQVGAVLEVAEDDRALLPGRPADGREAQRAPPPFVRRGPQEAAATEPVERSMDAPGRVHEPRRRHPRRSAGRHAVPHRQLLLRQRSVTTTLPRTWPSATVDAPRRGPRAGTPWRSAPAAGRRRPCGQLLEIGCSGWTNTYRPPWSRIDGSTTGHRSRADRPADRGGVAHRVAADEVEHGVDRFGQLLADRPGGVVVHLVRAGVAR